MKKHVLSRLFLRWIISVGSFWLCITLFPYDFYCMGFDRPVPFMSFGQIMFLLACTALAGTAQWLILLGLQWVGKWIGMYKHLLLLLIYHFAICTALPYLFVRLTGWIDIQPYEMYALLGFIPALLYAIVFSYEHSKARHAPKKQNTDPPQAE